MYQWKKTLFRHTMTKIKNKRLCCVTLIMLWNTTKSVFYQICCRKMIIF